MGALLGTGQGEEARLLKVAIHGASGKMGQAIVRLAANERAQIVGAIVSRGSSRDRKSVV